MASNQSEGAPTPARRRTQGCRASLETARERTASAYEAARNRASDVTRQASEQISVYPVAAVVGGFAARRPARDPAAAQRAREPIARQDRPPADQRGARGRPAGLDAGKDQFEEIRAKAAQKVGEAVSEAVVDAVAGKD